MALVEDVIFSDPVLKRIFFDDRWFAARSAYAQSQVAGLDMAISEDKVEFQKASTPAQAEYWQRKMRGKWFDIRKLCDGYHIKFPIAGFDDGCEHVELFAHDADSDAFAVDMRARAAYWFKYAQRRAPAWGDSAYSEPRRRRRRR
jgi:hypothetical protein